MECSTRNPERIVEDRTIINKAFWYQKRTSIARTRDSTAFKEFMSKKNTRYELH